MTPRASARGRREAPTQIADQRRYVVVTCVLNYPSFEAALAVPDDSAAHVQRSKALDAAGKLLIIGAFSGRYGRAAHYHDRTSRFKSLPERSRVRVLSQKRDGGATFDRYPVHESMLVAIGPLA
jgi:hypothetical protein